MVRDMVKRLLKFLFWSIALLVYAALGWLAAFYLGAV